MLGRRLDGSRGEFIGTRSGTTELSFVADDGGEGFAERKRLHCEPGAGRSQFFARIAVSGAADLPFGFGGRGAVRHLVAQPAARKLGDPGKRRRVVDDSVGGENPLLRQDQGQRHPRFI